MTLEELLDALPAEADPEATITLTIKAPECFRFAASSVPHGFRELEHRREGPPIRTPSGRELFLHTFTWRH